MSNYNTNLATKEEKIIPFKNTNYNETNALIMELIQELKESNEMNAELIKEVKKCNEEISNLKEEVRETGNPNKIVMLDVNDVQKILGGCGEKTARKILGDKELKTIKLSKKILVEQDVLKDYLSQHRDKYSSLYWRNQKIAA